MASAIVITGTVLQDARAYRSRDGRSVLAVDITPPNLDGSRPARVRIVHSMGTGNAAAYAAAARAARLKRGVRVEAHGAGLRAGRGGMVLQGLDRLHEPDLVLRDTTGERQAHDQYHEQAPDAP